MRAAIAIILLLINMIVVAIMNSDPVLLDSSITVARLASSRTSLATKMAGVVDGC